MTREGEIEQAAIKRFGMLNCDAAENFIDGAVWADAHPHWINVEDKLPPRKSEYDDLSNNVLATDGKEIYKSVYNHDFEEWFTHDMWGLDNITHWMPLPQVPKEGD